MTTSTVPLVTWMVIWFFKIFAPSSDTRSNCGTIWAFIIGQAYAIFCLWFSYTVPSGIIMIVALQSWDVLWICVIAVGSTLFLFWISFGCFDLTVNLTCRIYTASMLAILSGMVCLMCYMWVPITCYRMGVDFPKFKQCFFFLQKYPPENN